WHNKTKGKAQRYSMERNPFFHRVDTAGRQLPYIDKVYMSVASSGLIPAKANAGEVDLQAKGLSFRDMPVLKQGEKNGRYVTHLWPTGSGSHIAIYPNLTTTDPAWRRLNRDVRFRRALSLGIDRALINETLYFGLAREGGNAAIRSSPFYDRQRAEAWAQYDPDFANALLDEIGLTLRDANKIRLLPNGQPLEIVIETAGERLEEVEALQLVGETWRELGVKLLTRPTDRDLLRNRTYSGQTVMTAWKGWDNGVPTANTSPAELAPTDQATLCWSAWGEHYATGGSAGSAPDYAPARELLTFYKSWMDTEDEDRRSEIWRSMLAIHADQQFIIGILCEAPQPVVVADSLRNVPKDGLYAWAPGAHFGIHRPDEWWFDDAERRA
ncbi:MAG: ABC transporter substrate-binding protein, partial [Pseudomonadota bacterium]